MEPMNLTFMIHDDLSIFILNNFINDSPRMLVKNVRHVWMFVSCLEHLRNNLRRQFLHGQAPRSATITASQVRFVDGCLSVDSRLASLKTSHFPRQDPPFSLDILETLYKLSFAILCNPWCRGCFPTHADLSWGSHLLLTTCRTRKCGAWKGKLSENLSSGPLFSDTGHLVMPHWIRKKCGASSSDTCSFMEPNVPWNHLVILNTDTTQGIGAKIQGVPAEFSWDEPKRAVSWLALSKLAELKWRCLSCFFFQFCRSSFNGF